ncbi:hypothetical protein PT974_05837 [Cladobotryum mycophilum]|uniref:COX assembly mitochondrial protein n=1 Tax=Cladobotryum mycophilum TaxID=491253 RepID=A0ABR0SJZ0_9HYPO
MAAETPQVPQERLGVPSRNPLPLSASQEAQVRDIYYARVRKQCADEIKGKKKKEKGIHLGRVKHGLRHYRPTPQPLSFELASNDADCDPIAFADCALGRTFTVSFACRAEHRAMNGCMKLKATPAEHDAAREEWFALRMERQRARERKTKMAAAQEEFMREWWGLPEDVRLSKQKEMERRGESIPPRPAGTK